MVKKVKKAQTLELRKHLMVGALCFLQILPAMGVASLFWTTSDLLIHGLDCLLVEGVDLTLLYKRCLCTHTFFPYTHSLPPFLIYKFFLLVSAMALG